MPAGQTVTQPEPALWVCPPDQCHREQELLHTDVSFRLNSQGWRSPCLPSRLSRGLGALVLLVLVALVGTLLLGRMQGTSALPCWPGELPAGQWRWKCPCPCAGAPWHSMSRGEPIHGTGQCWWNRRQFQPAEERCDFPRSANFSRQRNHLPAQAQRRGKT